MTIQVSTKFKELILGANAFVDIFQFGRILIYSGAAPASADHPPTGTLLAQITNDGQAWAPGGSAGALEFEQVGAFVSKLGSQAWRLKVDTTGIAGWFRLVAGAEDAGALSYQHARIDGNVGASSAADLRLNNVNLTAGQNLPVQQFLYTLPPLGA